MLRNDIALKQLRGVSKVTLNPFNIRFSKIKWLGQTGAHKGFVCFESLRYGLRAGIVLLRNYVDYNDLHTVDGIICRYAPSSENNTFAYINYVRRCFERYNMRPSVYSTSDYSFFILCQAVVKYESNLEITYDDFLDVVDMFNIKLK